MLGIEACEEIQPVFDIEEIRLKLQQVTDLKEILQSTGMLPLGGVTNIAPLLARARLDNMVLSAPELLQVAQSASAAMEISGMMQDWKDIATEIYKITSRLRPVSGLSRAIDRSIGPDGDILDGASPELKKIRQGIIRSRKRVITELQDYFHREDLKGIFQDDIVTVRNDRFVIPLKSDCRGRLRGIVHDQSQSRATLFIEPLVVVEHNNEVHLLQREEKAEELRILRDLTLQVKGLINELQENQEVMAQLDLISAKARLSRDLEGRAMELKPEGGLKFLGARHPLLALQAKEDDFKAIPVDLMLGEDFDCLIITGANTGGKTVALKSLGLITLMTLAGMHTPVSEGSYMGPVRRVLADIGDEQNIESHQSTFSSHLNNINLFLKEVTPSTLVLLDELGTGTDPVEGGALAAAILDRLLQKGGWVAVTTHLNSLKAYAFSNDKVENGSVLFDPNTLQPTYKIHYGTPGFSNALVIAEKLGLAADISEAARQYLTGADEKVLDLSRLLQEKLALTDRELEEISRLKKNTQELSTALNKWHERIKDSYWKMVGEFREQSEDLIGSAKREIKEASRRLQENMKSVEASTIVNRSEDRLKKAFPHKPLDDEPPVTELFVGQTVRLKGSRKNGRVLKVFPDDKRAEVLFGGMRAKVNYSDLKTVQDDKRSRDGSVNYYLTRDSTPATEINILGLTVDEAIPLVDKFIDDAVLAGLPSVQIIHGIGTGKLKEAVRQFLKSHRMVKRFISDDPELGNPGMTIAEL